MTIKYYQAPLQSRTVSHHFFTRKGGVSTGVCESLCFSYKRYSDADIQENIARVEREIGVEPGYLKLLNQVHSNECVVVDDVDTPTHTMAADAIITTTPGIAVAVMTADCCPILVWDEDTPIAAAIHAGWRGAAKGVIENTIAKMIAMGASLGSMRAAIGPTISQASYEVDSPVFEAFSNARDYFIPVRNHSNTSSRANEESVVIQKDQPLNWMATPLSEVRHDGKDIGAIKQSKWQFNLPGYCEGVLTGLGIGQVHNLNLDTYTNEAEFFSCRRATHRKESGFGGHLSVVKLVL